MSHVEHTDVVLDRLVSIWDEGLSRKFPHYRRSNNNSLQMNRAMSVVAPNDLRSVVTGSVLKQAANADWPMSEVTIIDLLTKVMLSRMDRWSISSILGRLRKPGRLVLGPALFLPILIIQVRKILSSKKFSRKERAVEFGLLLYMVFLIFVVQEVTRQEG